MLTITYGNHRLSFLFSPIRTIEKQEVYLQGEWIGMISPKKNLPIGGK